MYSVQINGLYLNAYYPVRENFEDILQFSMINKLEFENKQDVINFLNDIIITQTDNIKENIEKKKEYGFETEEEINEYNEKGNNFILFVEKLKKHIVKLPENLEESINNINE